MLFFRPQTGAVDEPSADLDNGAAEDEGNLKHRILYLVFYSSK